MENSNNYYIFQFKDNGFFVNQEYIETLKTCIKENIIKAPSLFDKPLFIVQGGYYYIKIKYVISICEDLNLAVKSNIASELKAKCQNLLDYITHEYNNNQRNDAYTKTTGSTIESLLEFCRNANYKGESSNSF